jgi:hypothetical protein
MISKEQFCYYINEIKRHNEIADKVNYQLRKFDFCSFGYGDYEDLLVSLLQDIFNDKPKDNYKHYESDISYFLYELDFGKKYKDGMITEKIDGKEVNIKLATAEDLYELLIKKMKENEEGIRVTINL